MRVPQAQVVAAGRDALRAATTGELSLLAGALPFHPQHPSSLVVADTVSRAAAHTAAATRLLGSLAPARARRPRPLSVVARPAKSGYVDSVAAALRRLARTEGAAKVVLSRELIVDFDRPLNPLALLARLRSDPHAAAFCVPLAPATSGSHRTLVGASPELLVAKHGSRVESAPLAGSARRERDPAADRAAHERLAASSKDQREHALVVEWIADRLAPFCRSLRVPAAPSLVATDAMWHLGTSIDGELADADMSSLELAALLHPTPAVCGTPHEWARQAIAELEPFDRGYFGGAVGWCDSRGDGRWMVAIRCGEIDGRTARVFAGAGIVPGSEPEAEAAETSAKLTTFLRALGIDESGRLLTGGSW